MRLLRIHDDGNITLTSGFISDNMSPAYAILSHTWSEHEVTFSDMKNGIGERKQGYEKLRFCAQQARKDCLMYFWVETCCIDKDSHVELQEAINSMFRWFQNAAKCYVFLTDVCAASPEVSDLLTLALAFRGSRWFTRAWTLQELLAPCRVEFFSREGMALGDRGTLAQQIHATTGISVAALLGAPLNDFGVEERISWVEHRQVTREEDKAYSLLGIFGVFLPVLYGEGQQNSFRRLRAAIQGSSEAFAQEQQFRYRDPLQYHPLNESEIRILVLYPREQSEDLRAHLETTVVSSALGYQALSYVWGQEPALHPFQINEREKIVIRPNLYHALHRMRLQTESIRLWVDSICINQSDEEERNLQVQRMGDIYRQARNVWIWLGEEYSDSASAMDLMPQINRSDFQWKDAWWNLHEFQAFNNLLGRPWFQRGWVLQEAAFSANSIVFCGHRRIDWRDLATSVQLVRSHMHAALSSHISIGFTLHPQLLLNNFHESAASRLLDIVTNIFQLQENGQIEKTLTLERLVELGTHFDTTDPRDAVYALLNLAKDVSPESRTVSYDIIVPNYGKDTLDVFADFIVHCCHSSESLDIICRPWAPVQISRAHNMHTSSQSGYVHATNMPSWIQTRDRLPFGEPSARSSNRLHSDSLVEWCDTQLYNAHYHSRPQAEVLRRDGNGRSCLSLLARGVVIGVVTHRSMRMANAIVTKDSLAVLREAYKNSQTSLMVQLEAIARILCADIPGRRNNTDGCGAAVVQWLRHTFEVLPTGETPPGIDIEEKLDESPSQAIKEYLEVVRQCVWNRRTFCGKRINDSESAFAGILPQNARLGDTLCVLYGCSVPVVLRRIQAGERCHWQLIGEAYVQGFMDGEGITLLPPTMLASAEVAFDIQ